MRAQEEMHRESERGLSRLPEEDRERLRYESDYYGFRGAGRRGSYETEYRVQPRYPGRMTDGGTIRRRPPPPPRRRRR